MSSAAPSWRRPALVAALVLGLVAATGGVVAATLGGGPEARTVAAPPLVPDGDDGRGPDWATGDPGLKQVQSGLLSPGGQLPRARYRAAVTGLVVDVPWADLQPAAGGGLAPDNQLDRALAAVRAVQAGGGRPLTVKLRVFAGTGAPEWAKRLGGPPVEVVDDREGADSGSKGERGTVGRFWTPEYGAAYTRLQELLAAAYDDEPELLATSITRCTTFYGEPFLRQAGAPAVARALYDAGYTPEADEQCLREQPAAHQVWQHTRSALALNPYQRVRADGGFDIDPELALTEARRCREVLAAACQLENHSLRWPLQDGPYDALYAGLVELGTPLSLQSAAPERIGDATSALRWAAEVGADSVELNRSYDRYDVADLERTAAALRRAGR